MLHLVSKHSLAKPNPKKERELALQLEQERGEILIPINVDGTKPSELPWRIVDVAYIPFQNWATGLTQLLKKLNSVEAPRPLEGVGRDIAGSAFLVRSAVTDGEEELVSNAFEFTSVPKVVRCFHFPQIVSGEQTFVLKREWAFRDLGGRRALAFAPPPKSLGATFAAEETDRIEWRRGHTVEGILTEHLVSELLSKSLELHCRKRGLVMDPGGRGFYFPMGLLPRNTLFFEGYLGRRTRVLACGQRAFGGRKYRYHLCPWFRVRNDLGSEFVALFRLRVHLADCSGAPLENRATLARRKKIGSAWWNGQWLNRQLAVISFLANGETEIRIGEDPESHVVLAGTSMGGSLSRSIDEDFLTNIGIPVGPLMPEEDGHREGDE
jgi:hypothetical protein